MADENKQQRFPSLDLVFELAKEKLHLQSDQWNAIDSKNAIVLAVYGIILAIYLGAGENCFLIYHKYISLLWLATIAAGMACSIISLLPRDIDLPPKINKLAEKYLNQNEYDTKNSLLSTMETSIDINDKIIDRKTFYLSLSIKVLLPFALAISIFAVFFKIISRG